MLIAMAQDIRVILVKLADRTHNMRTLEYMREDKQQRIAQETLDIYAPLANRLGISWIKIELEDLLPVPRADEYADLAERVGRRKKEREQYIEDVVRLIETKLAERELAGEVSGRFKHLLQIYKKMRAQRIDFEQIYDIIAFRVIVPDRARLLRGARRHPPAVEAGAGALQGLHRAPQAQHVPVAPHHGDRAAGERMEVQIRTEEMHRIAEEGIAAHWAYKEGKRARSRRDDEKFAWLRQLMEWQRDLKDPKEFLETVKVDLFTDEVFVFTPKGDVKSLPARRHAGRLRLRHPLRGRRPLRRAPR